MAKRVRVTVRGRVQGVGFRWFTRELAAKKNISGWVRNLPDGSVELEAEGSDGDIGSFLSSLKTEHPYARIDALDSREIPPAGTHDRFEIR